jgi:hypothetical protein
MSHMDAVERLGAICDKQDAEIARLRAALVDAAEALYTLRRLLGRGNGTDFVWDGMEEAEAIARKAASE